MSARTGFIALSIAVAIVPGNACSQATSLTPFADAPFGVDQYTVRIGTPITFSGRILPADATGTLTLTINNVPVQTVPLAIQTLSDYVALGDSITYGSYIADPAQRYPNILAKSFSLNVSNFALPGSGGCDVMPTQALPFSVGDAVATNPLYTLLIGTDDLALFGTGAHEQVFNLCHQATLAWLGVPLASKVLIGNAAAQIASGTWSATSANTLSTANAGSTLRFDLTTTGAPAYLWYGIQTSASGSFTVSVDGGPPNVATSTGASTSGVGSSSFALLRIPIAAGSHTFDVVDQSGTVTILGMGSPPAVAGPTVLAGDIPNQGSGNTSGIAAYTADIQANVALLDADGLAIRFVPTQHTMLATPAEMMDTKHPNATGLAELAAAFAAAISPATRSTDSIATSTASFAAVSPSLGTHSVEIFYSGDTRYSPGKADFPPIVIFNGSSTAALTSDANVYPVSSPIVLTASVPQPNASGLVNFVDESGPLGSAWLNQPTAGQAQLVLPGLSAGVHTISAQYLGDVTFGAASSPTITVTVSGVYTATSLTSPATRYFATTPVQLTADVTPASATGTIRFLDGNVSLGQVPVVSGTATLTSAALVPGIHPLAAAYSGSTSQDPSTSATLSIEVDPNATVTGLSSSPASAPFGSPITIVTTVEPSAATGMVTLLNGSQSLGQGALSNGTATFIASSFNPGTHTLTAVYSGDTNYLSSSGSITTQVTLAPSTVALAPIPATATARAPIALTATIHPIAATGSIAFLDGNTTLVQVAVAGGTAGTVIGTFAPGPHSITAVYSGDGLRSPSTSLAVSTTITSAVSSIALAPLPVGIYAGNQIAIAAAISPVSATGTAVFRDRTLGVLGQSTIASGAATLLLPTPAVGLYAITATYSGDTDDAAATSNSVTTRVNLNPTVSSLTASTNAAVVGTPILFTANVLPAAATGSFNFLDGNTLIGSAPVANGQSSLTTAALVGGPHALHASYSGDALYAASIAAPLAETVTPATTAATLSLTQNSIFASGQIVANVAVFSPAADPTGTISLRSGSSLLASGTLGNASNGTAYATLSIPAAALGIGTFPLAAIYSGDAANQSSSASANIAIAAIPTTASLTLSASQVPIQSSTSLTIAVTAHATGSVTFLSNGTVLATIALGLGGSASFAFTPPAIGTYVLTAAYTANGLYASSTSNAKILTVTAPLDAVLNPATVTASPGATQSATLLLTPLSGFAGPIRATCNASVSFIQCTVPAPATLSASLSVPVQISVSRTTSTASFPASRGLGIAALALLLPFVRRRPRRSLLPAIFLSGALFMVGCAEGGSFNSVPPGVWIVSVTVTAANTPITTGLTVNVAY